jgi:thiosulfate/3-mercaptopyruvate sulfurtransferase
MMNKMKIILLLTIISLCIGVAFSRDVSAIVSTDWLSQNLGNSKMIVIDIRTAAQYGKGHIAGAINVPFSLWAISNNGLSLELPSDQALRDLLQRSGIEDSSIVVVVNRAETDFNRADATRVAWTCLIAGVKNVAVLDGGYEKWINDKKNVSTDSVIAKSSAKTITISRSAIASKEYVLSRIGKAVILDTRVAEDYFGKTAKPGHIKSAVDLPAPWAYATDRTFIKEEELRAIAAGVIGTDKSKEVITYCQVGGFAATWWFVLTQVLGYQNVKVYDGSMEEWLKDPKAPVSTYSWR